MLEKISERPLDFRSFPAFTEDLASLNRNIGEKGEGKYRATRLDQEKNILLDVLPIVVGLCELYFTEFPLITSSQKSDRREGILFCIV